MKIGSVLRTWREAQKLGLRAVAKQIGINHGTLARIERGEEVDGGTLVKLFIWLFY